VRKTESQKQQRREGEKRFQNSIRGKRKKGGRTKKRGGEKPIKKYAREEGAKETTGPV